MMVVLMMLGVLAVWVLLPLAPAILMFRLVPGNAITLSGPLANLTLNASGAIAAYFAVFVVIAFFVGDVKQRTIPTPRQYWTVTGDIELLDANGQKEKFHRYATGIRFATSPQAYDINPDTAAFRAKVVEREGVLPSIRIEVDKFGLGVIKVVRGDPDQDFQDDTNNIVLRQPLRVHQDPAYVPRTDRQAAEPRPERPAEN